MDPAKFQTWYEGKLAAASATPTPVPSGGGGPVVDLVAEGVKFDKSEIDSQAGRTIHDPLRQPDAGTPHDVDILDASGAKVFDGQDFPGPGVRDYGVQPLPAGEYQFVCSIHPTLMFGTLKVQ